MAQAPYIGSALPVKVITTDGQTNLFRYAQQEMGDALYAWQIAAFNDLSDFWPGANIALKIPPTAADDNGGVPPT
jgi:hypothetical protein